MRVPLECENIEFEMSYMMQTEEMGAVKIAHTCSESNGVLMFEIVENSTLFESIRVHNDQFLRLMITYKGEDLQSAIPGARLYLLYYGQSYYFTGKVYREIRFTSLDLPFGSFYTTQLAPIRYMTLASLWQIGVIGFYYDSTLLFEFGEPYFHTKIPDYQERQMKIYYKYSNGNNPFVKAKIVPNTIFGGLEKIGGYITFIGLAKIILHYYNKKRFERDLKKVYKKNMGESGDSMMVKMKVIKDKLSYEKLIEIILEHKRGKRKKEMHKYSGVVVLEKEEEEESPLLVEERKSLA